VHDVGAGVAQRPADAAHRRDVAYAEMPAHRHPRDAERERRHQRGQRRFRPFAAGRRIRHDADAVAGRRLGAHQVDHVTKQSTDRRAEHVQDGEGPRWPRHVNIFRTSS
jgi:hypothetical protein